MISIYICEDNPKQLDSFQKYISNLVMIEGLDMQIALATPSPQELLDAVLADENTGLFFLDIDLNSDINGLMLAQQIRRIQPRCFIIFITSHLEMGFLTFQYKVEALDFIIKNSPEQIKSRIHECLLDVDRKYTSTNGNNHTFMIHQNNRCTAVSYDEIIFFETSSNIHKIILHAKNRVIEFAGQLKDIENELDSRFYKCHRSYIINRDNISEIDFDALTVHMNNGESCPVSVRRKKELLKLTAADCPHQ